MSEIRVESDALLRAAGTLQRLAVDAAQPLRPAPTGIPEIDAALTEFSRAWATAVLAWSATVRSLAMGVASAAATYDAVDSSLLPGTRP